MGKTVTQHQDNSITSVIQHLLITCLENVNSNEEINFSDQLKSTAI